MKITINPGDWVNVVQTEQPGFYGLFINGESKGFVNEAGKALIEKAVKVAKQKEGQA